MKKIILLGFVFMLSLTACTANQSLTVGEFKLQERQMGLDKVEGN